MGAVSIKIPGFGEVVTPIQDGDRVSDVVRKAITQVNRDPDQPWKVMVNESVVEPSAAASTIEGETVYVTFTARVA